MQYNRACNNPHNIFSLCKRRQLKFSPFSSQSIAHWLHNASNYNFDFFMMKLLLLEIIPRDFEFHTRKIFTLLCQPVSTKTAAKVGEEEENV